MNADWFQPFKNTEYSLGVIYLAITNIPWEIRFKWENIIECGIIPCPKEPKLNINTYLKPIVNKLEKLWKGFYLNDGGYSRKSLFKLAIICLSSDIPATRKCGGFLGFSANKDENRMLSKIFTNFIFNYQFLPFYCPAHY